MHSRRHLPSLSLLTAFEAVVRHRAITGAARELSLSQSTVSRLVQSLEEQLGQPLFVRHKRRLIPTEAALDYQRDVARALEIIQRASRTVSASAGAGTLSLAVLPTFATRWLAPRLGGFFDQHPGVSINLSTRIQRFSFAAEAFDAVIYFGDAPDWTDAHHLKLFDEALTACAAPAFLAQTPLDTVAEVGAAPRLQLESRPEAWASWFAAQGGHPTRPTVMVMDQFSTMIQTAIAGLGVALLPAYLAALEIAEGRLVPVLRPEVTGTGSYWLAWPAERDSHAALRHFREWVVTA